MRRWGSFLLALLTLGAALLCSSCSLFGGGKGSAEQMFDEMTEMTGKWICYDPDGQVTDAYFVFDGAKGAMTFAYYENGQKVRGGTFRGVYRGESKEVNWPLSLGFDGQNGGKRDWIHAFVDDFKSDFTQFTVIQEERDKDPVDGVPQAHLYRMSELPFAFGTYVREGSAPKESRRNFEDADRYVIPNGTYAGEDGSTWTFLSNCAASGNLVRWQKGNDVLEAVYTLSTDGTILFLYIDHNPAEKPTREEKREYGIDLYWPPEYNIHGSFTVTENTPYLRFDRFEPTSVGASRQDGFTTGTFTRQGN